MYHQKDDYSMLDCPKYNFRTSKNHNVWKQIYNGISFLPTL